MRDITIAILVWPLYNDPIINEGEAMTDITLEVAQSIYNVMGRDSAINFMRANWKVSNPEALEEIVDLINYVADMAEMER
jgi:hypothetical protein